MLWSTVKNLFSSPNKFGQNTPQQAYRFLYNAEFLPWIPHKYYAESTPSCFNLGEESERVQKSHQALGWPSSQSPFHTSVMYRNTQRYEGTHSHWWTVFAQTHYWISAIFTWHFGPLLPVWHLRARTTCLWRDDYIMVRPHTHLVYSWGATNIEGSN